MERWAANTLRTLGIVVTAALTLAVSLFLLLLSWCASMGSIGGGKPRPDEAAPYVMGAIAVLVIGVFIMARLGRAIARSTREMQAAGIEPGSPSLAEPATEVPLRISPASHKALLNLKYAIAAALVVGLAMWAFYFSSYWMKIGSTPQAGALFRYQRYTLITSIVTAILFRLPYILLLIRLARKPDRPALAFSLAVPAAMILQTLTDLPLVRFLSVRGAAVSFGPLGIGLALDVLILIMAWRANERLGYRQVPSSLVVAGVAAYVYLLVFGSSASWLYRFFR